MTKNKMNLVLLILWTLLIIWQYTDRATYIETAVLEAVASRRIGNLTDMVIAITNSVSIIYYSLMVLLLVGWYYAKYRQIPWLLPLPLVINSLLFYILKIMIQRPRPITMLVTQHDFSFPSGHTLSAMMMVYIVILFTYSVYPEKEHILISIIGVLYITLIIFTRLYLGVHYPSDILGSLVLGGLFIINSYQYLLKKLVKLL